MYRQPMAGDRRSSHGATLGQRRGRGARRCALALASLLGAVGIVGCGGSSAGSSTAHAGGRGSVAVLFAGSLESLMERRLGPAFEGATGYGFDGYGGGSTELAAQVKSGVRRGDVFVSASATADAALEGAANGRWVSWYAAFMGTPLELAYNPASRFGRELRRGEPWYRVLAQPGIRVGRTDPKLDPKGVLTVDAVEEAARELHDAALAKALASFEVFPETALVGRLQSGQLDAGFLYAVEAKTAGLPSVSLKPASESAQYTVTILRGAPNPAGAAAFVRYLLRSKGSYSLAADGLEPLQPRFSGSVAAVPAELRSLVGAG